MAQQTINNLETGKVVRDKINENFTENYSDIATNTSNISTNASNIIKNNELVTGTYIVNNLLDESKLIDGYTLKTFSTDTVTIDDYLIVAASQISTPIIEVTEEVTYRFLKVTGSLAVGTVMLFDEWGNYVSHSSTVSEILIPLGVSYIACSFVKSSNYPAMIKIVDGGYTTDYEKYESNAVTEDNLKSELVDYSKIDNKDFCGLIKNEGHYYFDFTSSNASTTESELGDEFKRNGVYSQNVYIPNTILTEFVNLVFPISRPPFESIGILMYLETSDIAEIANGGLVIYLTNSATSTSNSLKVTIPSSSLHAGWFLYKTPLSELTLTGTLDSNDSTHIIVSFYRNGSVVNDCNIIVNSVITDISMKPTIMVNFDGLYDTDIDTSGKFDVLEDNNIPFTVFNSSRGALSATVFSRLAGYIAEGNSEASHYALKDDAAINSTYGLTETKELLYVESNFEEQFKQLKITSEFVQDNYISGLESYSAPQGIMTGSTIRFLKMLGYKIGRDGGDPYTAKFSKDDFAISSISMNTSTPTQDIKDAIDKAIEYGYCLSIFTHEVTAGGGSIDATTAQFTEIMSYIETQRTSGLLQTMTFTDFYNSCTK